MGEWGNFDNELFSCYIEQMANTFLFKHYPEKEF